MGGKHVASVSHRLDQLEFNIAELSANPAEQHVDGPIEDITIAAVGRVQQIFAREHSSGPRHQCMQEIEFSGGQVQQPTARINTPPQSRLQLEAFETVFPGRMRNLARVILTTKHRADTGRKFARIEWLAEIVIGANLKTDDTVDVLLQCGEKNDRNKRVLGSHIPTDFQAGSI